MLKRVLLALGTFLLMAVPLRAAVSVPSVTAAVFDPSPVIDGKLDDDSWRFPTPLSSFQLVGGKGLATQQTIASVGFDKKNLYISFECEESQMDKLVANYTKDGDLVWLDDCVEVFLSPYEVSTSTNYLHFAVNPNGAKTTENYEGITNKIKWTAKTSRGKDRWYVEIAIPFESIEPYAGLNEDCWRINLCRGENPKSEYSSWSFVGTSFHEFGRFGKLIQPGGGNKKFLGRRARLTPVVGFEGKDSVKPLPTDAAPVPQPETPIIPAPRELKYNQGKFVITAKTPIVVGDKITAMDRRAAEEIQQEVKEQLGFTLAIVPASKLAKGTPAIIVGEPGINALSKKLCAERKRVVTKSSPGREGYLLEATPTMILIAGSDQEGTFWGAETLRQMIRKAGGGKGFVRAAYIRDWPKMRYRGLHLLSCTDGLAFHSRCIEEVFSRYKLNYIIFEAEHVRWDSHPEVYNPQRGMSKDDVRKLIKVANQHHITVIPLIQSLGHMQWAFYNGKNKDLAEDPNQPYAFCPLNQKGYDFTFDIMDEAIELFNHPKYLHIGHDEFTNLGRFPVHEECQKIGKYQLYYDDTRRVYEHLKSKGVGTMMWGDILLKTGYREKIAELPKDIIITDWHYDPLAKFESLDFFQKAGLPILGCTWYLPKNLYNFSKAGYDHNIMGMIQTTWTGFMPSDQVFNKEFYQIYAYILGAEWAWSPSVRTPEKLGYDPEIVFNEDWNEKPIATAKTKYFSLPLQVHCNATPLDRENKIGWLGIKPGLDIATLPLGTWKMGGVPFKIQDPTISGAVAVLLKGPGVTSNYPDEVKGIQVGRKVKALHFVQATGWEVGTGTKVGQYRIHYYPAGEETVNLTYGDNITCWLNDRSIRRGSLAWRGSTASGQPMAFQRFTWTNPHPDREVQYVDFVSAGTDAAPILLAATAETE